MDKKLQIHQLDIRNKVYRAIWKFCWILFFRFTPRPFHPWRCFLLRLFGARLGMGVHVYPSARIWAPWNLEMGNHACLSEFVDCYSVEKIRIGHYSTVSQYSFLCTASHDYTKLSMPLIVAPILIGDYVWIAADVFVGPSITIGDGTVINARSTVLDNMSSWIVAKGNPATQFKKRILEGGL